MQIRPATMDHLDALVSLLTILFGQEAEMVPDAQAQRRGLTMILNTPDAGFIFVAEGDAQILGMCSVLFTISTVLGGRVGVLEDVVVLPTHRNQGVGSALVRAAIESARDAGCLRLTLLTDQNNTIAQRLYERFGFTASTMKPLRLRLN